MDQLTNNTDTKHIHIILASPEGKGKGKPNATDEEPKERRKKKLTETECWQTTVEQYGASIDTQLILLRELSNVLTNSSSITPQVKMLYRMLKIKQSSYKAQDMEKKLYDNMRFVSIEDIVNRLLSCGLICYYCNNPTTLLYETAFDETQWTLERVDNSYGHNRDNIEIACLKCNIRRRTMYHERYLFTKQAVVRKLDT